MVAKDSINSLLYKQSCFSEPGDVDDQGSVNNLGVGDTKF